MTFNIEKYQSETPYFYTDNTLVTLPSITIHGTDNQEVERDFTFYVNPERLSDLVNVKVGERCYNQVNETFFFIPYVPGTQGFMLNINQMFFLSDTYPFYFGSDDWEITGKYGNWDVTYWANSVYNDENETDTGTEVPSTPPSIDTSEIVEYFQQSIMIQIAILVGVGFNFGAVLFRHYRK